MISFFGKNKKKGFIVLTATLIVCATILIITTGVFLRSIGDLKGVNDSEASLKAWSAVNACGEYALLQMSTTTEGLPGWEYTGDYSLPVGAETCYIYPIENVDSAKLIKASSTISKFTRKVEIEIATNTPSLEISSWEIVADF